MDQGRQSPETASTSESGLDTTASLLVRIRQGDAAARERLLQRYLPALRRWARGRLPAAARDLNDTDDLVQVTLLKTLDQLDRFVPRHGGAFFAYLRRVLHNEICDAVRRARRRPRAESLDERQPDAARSPLESAIDDEALEAYEAAMAKLTAEQQEALWLRLELGFTHEEVADATGAASANAARMQVARALVRLAEAMDGSGGSSRDGSSRGDR